MPKKKKSNAKNLNEELLEQFRAFDLEHLFVREHAFAPGYPTWIFHKLKGGKWKWEATEKRRSWRSDFACIEAKLLIEVDGNNFHPGGHNTGPSLENQNLRTAEAELNGWMLLRVTRRMIEESVALDLIMRALTRRLSNGTRASN